MKKARQEQWIRERNIGGHLLTEPVMDYHVYEMSGREKTLYTLGAMLAGGIAGLLFYGGMFKENGTATLWTWLADAAVFMLAGIVAAAVYLPMRRDQLLEKRRKQLRQQFRDMLQILTNSLSAGATVNDAFNSSLKSMVEQYSKTAYITRELDQMVATSTHANIRLEDLLDDFAKRSGVEDIEDFGNVFRVARGPGGDIGEIMRNTHAIIGEKMEIEDEIASKMQSNRLELNVIMVAPFGIVAFLRFGGAFGEKFTSPSGLIASTVGIVLFITAWYIGQWIVKSVR